MGVAIGAATWTGHLWTYAAVLLLPLSMTLRLTKTIRGSFALFFGYFSGAMWLIVPGAALFFGNKMVTTDSVFLWVLYSILLAIAYILAAWRIQGYAVGLAITTIITVANPIAIVNPLTAAGFLFPALGFAGLAALIIAFATIPAHPRLSLATVFALAIVCNVLYKPTAPPVTWTAINTAYGGTSYGMRGTSEYEKASGIRDAMLQSADHVSLYPESTLAHWNDANAYFFRSVNRKLQNKGQTLLLGAEITHPGAKGYDNALILLGADHGVYYQHLPMPYSMWNPFVLDSAPLRLGGSYTIKVHNLIAAPVICYEQLHPLPFLRASLDHPQIILGVANDYWADRTYIGSIQRASLASWGRLFHIPYMSATNQ
jgi:hypothetical protein